MLNGKFYVKSLYDAHVERSIVEGIYDHYLMKADLRVNTSGK